MSPPRRHYGPKPPGRLSATMLKVLTAELSDASRLGRGKRLFEADAVIDLNIYPGRAEATVQGSRSEPYEVMLATRPGTGVPTSAEIAASCSCPDAERVRMCKHAVAAMFGLASEVAIEPELLSVWRGAAGGPSSSIADQEGDELAAVIPLFQTNSGASDFGDATDGDDADIGAEFDETANAINAMLLAPHGRDNGQPSVPDLGPVLPIKPKSSGDPTIDRLLNEIFDEFDIEW